MKEIRHFCGNFEFCLCLLFLFAWCIPAKAQGTGAVLEEVVVTARKREETLVDVPMSVDVFSGAQLEFSGIENTIDLIGTVPGLSLSGDVISPGKDFDYMVMRGVGANTGGDPAVPVFINGVYQPRLGLDMNFVDVERIEILKGPQGTLFGRNALGGAVNIVTRRPTDELRRKFAIEIDSFDSYKGQASISGGLTDKSFGSVVIEGLSTEGYLTNVGVGQANQGQISTNPTESADGGLNLSGRASFRYVASDNFELYLTGDYSKFTGLWGLPGVPRDCRCYQTENEFQIDAQDENYGGALHLDWSTGFGDLTSITGYRVLSTRLPFDFDGGYDRGPNFHDLMTDQDFLSQELRLSSSTSDARLSWIAGLYYFNEELDSRRRYDLRDQDFFPAGIKIDKQDTVIERDGWAAFGQAELLVTDRVKLTAGVRYSEEDSKGSVDLDYTLYEFLGPDMDFLVIGQAQESTTFDATTWTTSISFAPNDTTNTYITVAKGFKAGGYPLSSGSELEFIPFDDETSLNYEVGFKGRLLDERLHLEAAVYYIDLKDQQLAAVVDIQLPGSDTSIPVSTIANAGESHVQGFDVSLTALPTDNFRLTADIGLTDTEWDDYIDPEGTQHAGESFPYVPERTFGLSGEYTTDISPLGGYELTIGAHFRYVDDYFQGFDVAFDPLVNLDSYSILDLSATLSADVWKLQLFAENVTDEYIVTREWNSFFILPDRSRAFEAVMPPRKFGIRMVFEF